MEKEKLVVSKVEPGKRKSFNNILLIRYTLITIISILLVCLLYANFLKKESLTYYEPQYIPIGYYSVEPANTLVASDTMGLGVVLLYENGTQEIKITTYERQKDLSSSCTPINDSDSDFQNVEIYNIGNYQICRYTHKASGKFHYVNIEDKTVSIIEKIEPFLEGEEIEKIIASFEERSK